jgi:hypothetical protein
MSTRSRIEITPAERAARIAGIVERTQVMNTPHWMDRHPHHGAHGGHGLMMLVCCIPMFVLALALVATGAAGSGAIVGALLCTAMMAAMMLAMPGGHDHK